MRGPGQTIMIGIRAKLGYLFFNIRRLILSVRRVDIKAKKKDLQREQVRGEEAFDRYYGEFYGEGWPNLKKALLEDVDKVSLESPFEEKPSQNYELDQASTLVPTQLDFFEADRVLDMCAAPGGKSLCMLYGSKGKIELTCNELSLPRFKRLKAVMRDHLPRDLYESIRFMKTDGSRLGLKFKEEFDHVLLDAPCSGERHLLKTPSELKQWTAKRGKGLQQRQVALICSGFDCLKPGGTLVYSTCSIHALENDGVIAKLLKKRKHAESLDITFDEGIITEYGRLILPLQKKWGPIYTAKIRKQA